MARIFISHSSGNNAPAIALRDWLVENGWDDLFLDLDAERGLKAGQRWQEALKEAAERCELVIFVISPEWAASKWCLAEFLLAKNLNKRIFGVVAEPTPLSELPIEMTSEWQLVDLTAGDRSHKVTVTLPPGDTTEDVAFSGSGLERLRIGLMQAGLDARYFAWPPQDDPDRAPYRGLEPLQGEDAGIFFGRDGPIIVGLDQLRGLREGAPPRLLVILGASGAGKSSFLRAGLLPRLERESQHFVPLPVIRPERAALTGETGLLACLEKGLKDAGLGRSRSDIRKAIEAGPSAVAVLLRDIVAAHTVTLPDESSERGKPPSLVFSIDQAEELFHGEGAEEAQIVMTLLSALATEDDPAVIVLFTIRSESYESLQTAEAMQGLRQHPLSLPPMPKGAYAEVIKGPARRLEGTNRELKVEEPLVDALLADIEAGGAKDALPLLAFTLERLYREEGGDGDLKLTEYEDLGRVKGSIEAAVEEALKAADGNPKIPADRQARLALLRRGLIPWLAGIDPDTGSPRRRIAKRSEIPEECVPLIDLLIEQRLLSTDIAKDTGEVTIEPVHEALLRQWGLLQGWLIDDLAALTTLEGVKRASRDWAANAKGQDWLNHAGTRLEEAEEVAKRDDLAGDLRDDARTYLKQCRAKQDAREQERLAREKAEKEEQERRVRDAEALAAANKRAAQRTGIGLVAALVLVALAGWQWWEAGLARDKAEVAAVEATAQRDRAEQALNLATRTANSLIFDLVQKFQNVSGVPSFLIRDILDRVRTLQGDLISGGESRPTLRRSQSSALLETFDILIDLGDTDGALKAAKESEAILEDLLASDPNSTDYKRELSVAYEKVGNGLKAQGNLKDASEYYQKGLEISEQLAKSDPSNIGWQRGLSISYEKVGDVLKEQGKLDDALAMYKDSLDIAKGLADADPSNNLLQRHISISYVKVADVLKAQGNLDEATVYYDDSLAIKERLAKADPKNVDWLYGLSVSYERLGDVQRQQGRLGDALASYQDSLKIKRQLAASDRSNSAWQRGLGIGYEKVGIVLKAQGKLAEAFVFFTDSLDISKRLAAADPSNTAWQRGLSISHEKVGDVLKLQGKLKDALAAYEESRAIVERLVDSDPTNSGWQRHLSISHVKVGDVLKAQGNLDDAYAAFKDSRAITERLVEADPSNADWQNGLSVAYERVGDVLKAQDKLDKAEAAYLDSLKIAKSLAEADPSNTGWQRGLSISYIIVGDIFEAQGKLDESYAAYEDALAIAKRLAATDPTNIGWQRGLSISNERIGSVLVDQGKYDEAIEQYRASLNRMVPIRDAAPSNTDMQRFTSITHSLIGDALKAQGKLTEAVQSYTDSLEIAAMLAAIDPSNTQWRRDLNYRINRVGMLGYELLIAGDAAGSLKASDDVLAVAPERLWVQANRAHALMVLGRDDEARDIYMQHRGAENVSDGKPWEVVIDSDFAALRDADLARPLMDEVERAFAQAAPARAEPEDAAQ